MLHFDNDPATQRAVGTTMEPDASELSPADDAIVFECIGKFHPGSVLQNSDKYGRGKTRHLPISVNLPLEESYIFTMVREGSYAAGTEYGCELP